MTKLRAHDAMRLAALVVAAWALLVGCGSDTTEPATPETDARTSSSASSPTPSSASTASTDSPLIGTWQAGPVSLEATLATLRRHGLGRWVEDYRANAPFLADTVLTLTIADGTWDLYGETGGAAPEPIDYDAEYEIDDDTVVFHHSDGSTTYHWSVDQDSLRLRYVRSTMPRYQGIPDEVFQRALYMTATFTRQG